MLAVLTFIGETFPSFGQILNLIGSTNVAITSIILPPILYTKLVYDHKLNQNWKKRKISPFVMIAFLVVVLTGIIGGFSSAYVTIVNWQPLSSACYISKSADPTSAPTTIYSSTTVQSSTTVHSFF